MVGLSVPRIGTLVFAVLLFSGFTAPQLPEGHSAIYQFHGRPTAGVAKSAMESKASSVFPLTVIFKGDTVWRSKPNHRGAAREFLKTLERILNAHSFGANISIQVEKVFVPTNEVTLSVTVYGPLTVEQARNEVLSVVRASALVSFAGIPARMRLIE